MVCLSTSPRPPRSFPLGEGDHELQMLKDLKESGFDGTIGILGHVEDQDAKAVLQKNIEGLRRLLRQLGDTSALETYR